jgi:hypothetical protein
MLAKKRIRQKLVNFLVKIIPFLDHLNHSTFNIKKEGGSNEPPVFIKKAGRGETCQPLADLSAGFWARLVSLCLIYPPLEDLN